MTYMNEQLDEIVERAIAAGVSIDTVHDGMDAFNKKFGAAKAEAKAKLQRLIVEARIEELQQTMPQTDGMRHYNAVKRRIAQLSKELEDGNS